MDRIIAACGNDCEKCPRHMPRGEGELRDTAVLWHKIGYRDEVVSNEQIRCFGCCADNWCRYEIVSCTAGRGLDNCGQCERYPCEKIEAAFEATMSFEPDCKRCCTKEEYEVMKRAFFEKRKNLDEI